MKVAEALAEIEQLVLHGSLGDAAKRIAEIAAKRIPRENAPLFASLARRTGQPGLGFVALHGIVRPLEKRKNDLAATDLEKSEYAAALNAMGASREALALLREVDQRKVPSARLFEGFALIRLWELDKAAEKFDEIANDPGMTELGRLRAAVQVASCLVDAERESDRAVAILERVLKDTGPDRFRMVHKDALLILAQAQLEKKQWSDAKRGLDRLDMLCEEEGDAFFLLLSRRTRAILAVLSSRDAATTIDELRAVREQLRSVHRWEDARQCHYYEALALENRSLYSHLYFGTPYQSFRAKIRQQLGKDALPSHYDWRILGQNTRDKKRSLPTFDAVNDLEPGSILQRLFRALCLDLFKPVRITELHELLYPGEHFNPHSSPDRMHQNLKRLRRYLIENRVPLEIAEKDSFYSLTSSTGCIVRIDDLTLDAWFSRDSETVTLHSAIATLRKKRGHADISAKDIAEVLDVSQRSALRIMTDAVTAGLVEKSGKARATRYRIKPD